MNIDTYIQDIMNADATSERNTYSFTCSSKTLEERAIMSYMNYLKDNNIAYGRFLKDVLYNAAIDSFDLSLPRKSAAITIGCSSSSNSTGVDSNDIKRLLTVLNNLNEKCDKQSEQICELHKIIENQTDLIRKLSLNNNNNNNDDIAVTDNEDYTDDYISEEESRAIKEREYMAKEMEGQTLSTMFPGLL